MKNGLQGKMAVMLSVPVGFILYDSSVDALTCSCGCGMEVSIATLRGLRVGSAERRVYKNLHKARKPK